MERTNFILTYITMQTKEKKADSTSAKSIITSERHAYFVGGGIASLAGAAYLIRDANFKGENIHILEGLNILWGSNDGIWTNEGGFVCRWGRMLNEETYENFQDLFRSIPSLTKKGKSVMEEILEFDHANPTHAQARLINKDAEILNAHKMGFNMDDRLKMLKLLRTPEEKLDNMTIEQRFWPHFFTTNFWYMWQTTFAFQKWSSLFELRRYMNRMILEFSRIDTLEWVTRTPLNQYDSLIIPLRDHLKEKGVDFDLKYTVTDLDFKEGNEIQVTAIHYESNGKKWLLELWEEDLCFVTNGCMTDNSSLGDYKTAPQYNAEKPMSGELWRKIAKKKKGLGNPEPFFGKPEETKWYSFTVTSKGDKLLKMIEKYSGNVPGSWALMTFVDSSWLLSIVVAKQPHFINQDKNVTIFWGYGLYIDKKGDYIKKPMKDCTGEEILEELLYHFHWQEKMKDIKKDIINVIPCIMPYIDAQFQPRAMTDRPLVVPKESKNLAFISQFVEIDKDMVFTEEYSVRAARTAVYQLLHIDKEVAPVTPHNKKIKVLLKALITAFR